MYLWFLGTYKRALLLLFIIVQYLGASLLSLDVKQGALCKQQKDYFLFREPDSIVWCAKLCRNTSPSFEQAYPPGHWKQKCAIAVCYTCVLYLCRCATNWLGFRDLQCCIGLCKYPHRGDNRAQEVTGRRGRTQWNLKEQQEVKSAWVTVMAVLFPMDLGIGFFFPWSKCL